MPVKKSPLIRYKIIDELISSRINYSMTDLLGELNARLEDIDDTYEHISMRTLQEDLKNLKMPPWNAEIVKRKGYVVYGDPGFTVFSKRISKEEKCLLKEVLGTIGQFKGLPNFEWLSNLRDSVGAGASAERPAISFSCNPRYTNLDYIAPIYNAIVTKKVLRFRYKPFEEEEENVVLHPYLLKQFNDRWYVFGHTDKYPMGIYPLDRIMATPEVIRDIAYNESDLEKLDNYFENIVGVTRTPNSKVEDIIFWVSGKNIQYVETKPLHETQTHIGKVEEKHLKNKYGNLGEGQFYRIKCIPNFELKKILLGQFENLVVLEPKELRNEIGQHIIKLSENYMKLRI